MNDRIIQSTMGIKNLFKLIKEYAPNAIQHVPMNELSGWKIGIDASISIYQWYAVGISQNVVNCDGKHINHVQGAFSRMTMFASFHIIPVFCFDGEPPAMKRTTLEKRKKLRDANTTIRVPGEAFEDVKSLLRTMNVSYIQAPSEAEAQAARLTTDGTLDAVATEDMDALTFGARKMIRGMDSSARTVTIITHADVLTELNLTNDQFIDLCILLGCDYTRTIPGIGYKRALILIKKYKTIENILSNCNIQIDGFEYLGARNEFKNPNVLRKHAEFMPIVFGRDDIVQLEEFLTSYKIDEKRIKKCLERLTTQ